jgi:hypothetical protein
MRLNPKELFRPDEKNRIKLRWEAFAYLDDKIVHGIYNSKEPLEIYLDQCDIIGHDGLIWILSLARWRKTLGLGATYVFLPHSETAISLIVDLDFPANLLRAGGIIGNENVLWGLGNRPNRPGFRRLVRTGGAYSPRSIQVVNSSTWANVYEALQRFFGEDVSDLLGVVGSHNQLLAEDATAFRETIGELVTNVALHGGPVGGSGLGYVCYRPWPRGYPLLRFCSADMGPGFSATLTRQLDRKFASEAEAILYALAYRFHYPKEGVLGLYNALPFIYQLGGRLQIRSLDASVFLDLGSDDIAQIFETEYKKNPPVEWIRKIVKCRLSPKVPGCHLALDLRLPAS